MAEASRVAVTDSQICGFRLYGDYESLRMCKLTDALVDFTGGVAETRTITNAQKNDAFQRNKLLNSLYKSIENRSLINCEIQVCIE